MCKISPMTTEALTQRDLARQLGVDGSAVTRWIKGDRQPKPEQAAVLLAYLDRIHRERCEQFAAVKDNLQRITKRKRVPKEKAATAL